MIYTIISFYIFFYFNSKGLSPYICDRGLRCHQRWLTSNICLYLHIYKEHDVFRTGNAHVHVYEISLPDIQSNSSLSHISTGSGHTIILSLLNKLACSLSLFNPVNMIFM